MFPNASANYYRPMNFLWFRVNDALFGLQPAGWHVMAILLHLLATALVFAIARRVTGRPLVAAVASLLFGIHPTRHEVVAWVSGTTESLWAVFFLLAFLAYLKSPGQDVSALEHAISCLAAGAGHMAKETAIVLPIVIFAHTWLYGSSADLRMIPGNLIGYGCQVASDWRPSTEWSLVPIWPCASAVLARLRASAVAYFARHDAANAAFGRIFLCAAMAVPITRRQRVLRSAAVVKL